MYAFRLDNKGDLIIQSGELQMVHQREELVQSLERILTTNKGEWFLDSNFGLDYPQIWGKGRTTAEIRNHITQALLQDSRVTSVDLQRIQVQGRQLIVQGSVTSIYEEELRLEEVIELV